MPLIVVLSTKAIEGYYMEGKAIITINVRATTIEYPSKQEG
jgi:hypothetical protein